MSGITKTDTNTSENGNDTPKACPPPDINVVTTFSREGAYIYGNRFIKQFTENCPHEIWFVGNECSPPGARCLPEVDAAHDFMAFCREHVQHTKFYKWQAARFAWKVFAYSHPGLPTTGWRVWMDADVEIFNRFDLGDILKDLRHVDVVYLGRPHWEHSECGFIAFNMDRRGGELIDEILLMYTSRSLFQEREWHDSWAFDVAREKLKLAEENINRATSGLEAWMYSPLGVFSRHNKGNEKMVRSAR